MKEHQLKFKRAVLSPSPGRAAPCCGVENGAPTVTSTVTVVGGTTSRTDARRARSMPECGRNNSKSLGRSTPNPAKACAVFGPTPSSVSRSANSGKRISGLLMLCRSAQASRLRQWFQRPRLRRLWPWTPPLARPPTRSVLAETDPATLAPRLSARAFASARVIFSSVPVNTTVFPATGLSTGARVTHRLHIQAAPPKHQSPHAPCHFGKWPSTEAARTAPTPSIDKQARPSPRPRPIVRCGHRRFKLHPKWHNDWPEGWPRFHRHAECQAQRSPGSAGSSAFHQSRQTGFRPISRPSLRGFSACCKPCAKRAL